MTESSNARKIGLGSNPLHNIFGGGSAPAPEIRKTISPMKIVPAEETDAPPPQLPDPIETQTTPTPPPQKGAGRSRQRKTADAPKDSTRTERVTIWLTPDERDNLQLLTMADGMTESSVGREAILKLLQRRDDVIDRAREFRNGLAQSS